MVFNPYTIDTGSTALSYKVTGLLPGKQYQYSVKAKNIIGTATVNSNIVTATTAAQAISTTPSLISGQTARFRADGPNAPASVTCSLPSVPNASNKIIVMIRAYGGGNDNGSITGPASATLIGGPFYDSGTSSEVMYYFMISNDNSNTYTFTGWDTSSNVGIMLQEVYGVSSWDFQHGAATETGTTAITWTFTPPSNTNCVRLVATSIQYAPGSIGAGTTGITVLSADPQSVVYHAGFLASVSPTTTSGSVAIIGGQGNATDGPVFISTNLYGSTIPAAVSGFNSSTVTSSGLRLNWNPLSDPSVSAYLIEYQGGGISSWTTFGLPLPSTSTNATITGLLPSTSYQFRVSGTNASGVGTPSTTASITTLSQSTLAFIQKAVATDTTGGTATSTLSATFSSPTTVGNTLVCFLTAFNDANNLALPAPTGAQGWTGILTDDGASAGIGAAWYLTVSSPQTTYNFTGIDDAGSFHVLEYQGAVSLSAFTHGGPLTYADNASVTLPVVQPGSTPAVSLYCLNMTNTPDSWGTPPTGFTLRSPITGNASSVITYHQGSVFEVASSVTTGNKTVPFSLLSSVPQAAPPTYMGVTIFGSASATPPGKVSGVVLGTATGTTQPITWSAATGTVTAYAVQYRVHGTSTYTTFASNIVSTNTTVTGLTAGTSYDYLVVAYNGSTAGTASDVATGSTLSSTPGQSIVTLGTATSTTQPISWTAASGTVTSYTVLFKQASAGSYTTFATNVTGTSSTVTGLNPQTSYNYQVIAYNGANAGPTSTTVTGSTLALPAPGQPTGVTLGTATSVAQPISWTASTGTVTSYSVLYSSSSSSGPWTTLPGITSTSTTVSGLIPSTIYYYEVIAFNGGSSSAASTVVNRTTAAATAPGTVTGLTAGTTSSSSINYTWAVPTGSVTSYTFQWKPTSGSTFTSVTGLTSPTYNLTGLSPNTSYTVQVLALSYTVAGSASTTVVATTANTGGGTGTQIVMVGGKILLVGGKMVLA